MRRFGASLFWALVLMPSLGHAADAEAQKIQTAIQESWERCMEVYALTVAQKTSERAEVIADAAITACQGEENKLYEFYLDRVEPLRTFLTATLFPSQKEEYRKKTLAKVLALRASQ